ncbi:uncharacterized protein LOC26535717 [Drosophila yakuba]|uniref:Uncharacterized protein n=1 Tax=Drosophila yakuba TaxID=7245 RepID=A0A0R1E2F7_DROYA|nr:uncharacterized protein LOC26535717 [Drosophila yakuba]KRK03305.1 uncharacterized protein Dyak_GE28536 [Drosophila yakuba]
MSEHKYHFKKDATFYEESESHQDLLTRTYGFLKAVKMDTPIPKKRASMNTHTLMERLHTIKDQLIQDQEKTVSENWSTATSSEDSHRVGKSEFELKRKLFDTAEFTITRGIKLSEIFCPKESGLHLPLTVKEPAALASFEEMKTFCRRMNIHLER